MKFNVKKLIAQLALGTLLASSYSTSFALQKLDSIAAVVNDDVITQRELQYRIADFKRSLKAEGKQQPDIRILQRQILERLILDKVQAQMAARGGIKVDDLTLNKSLERMAQQNRMTLPQLRERIIADGADFSQFREQMRNDLIVSRLQQSQVFNRIKVSDEEIEEFLKRQEKSGDNGVEYRLGHILVTLPRDASSDDIAAAQEKIARIRKELNEGNKFSKVAIEYSEGRQALKGGDLGWRKGTELPEFFTKVLGFLDKGDVSKTLRSPSGFHIIKVIDKDAKRIMMTQTRARHILITPDAITNEDQARLKLQSIRERIIAGEKFEDLAKEFSQDPGSRSRDGELGWADPGTFVPKFEQVMDTLRLGEVSEPFRSNFGWHIIEVMERREKDGTAEAQRNKAIDAIRRSKADVELQQWLRFIRDQAFVEYVK